MRIGRPCSMGCEIKSDGELSIQAHLPGVTVGAGVFLSDFGTMNYSKIVLYSTAVHCSCTVQ